MVAELLVFWDAFERHLQCTIIALGVLGEDDEGILTLVDKAIEGAAIWLLEHILVLKAQHPEEPLMVA